MGVCVGGNLGSFYINNLFILVLRNTDKANKIRIVTRLFLYSFNFLFFYSEEFFARFCTFSATDNFLGFLCCRQNRFLWHVGHLQIILHPCTYSLMCEGRNEKQTPVSWEWSCNPSVCSTIFEVKITIVL